MITNYTKPQLNYALILRAYDYGIRTAAELKVYIEGYRYAQN